MGEIPLSLPALKAELARGRQTWPILHEYSPGELGSHAGIRRDQFQWSVKLYDWLSFVCSGAAPPLVPDHLTLPVPSPSPLKSLDWILEAMQWFVDQRNILTAFSAIERVFMPIRGTKGSQWLIRYFVDSTFPTLYNHFSTAASATNGVEHDDEEKPFNPASFFGGGFTFATV
jgi:hypothetical protein